MLSCVPIGHGARPCFGTACTLVRGFGVHMPDVGLELNPLGHPLPTCGTGIGRRSSARATAARASKTKTAAPTSLAKAGKISTTAIIRATMTNGAHRLHLFAIVGSRFFSIPLGNYVRIARDGFILALPIEDFRGRLMQEINEFLAYHAEAVLYSGAAFFLFLHFFGRSRVGPFAVLTFLLAILSAAVFLILSQAPEPISFTLIAALLVIYGVTLFAILSDLMIWRLAKYLTAKRGEKWTKEMDYVYLTIGAAGILASLNRIEFLTGRFEGVDIIAPLVLTTAVVIRFIKTRAEIGGWNKP
jgi:hypothetical protein